MTFTPCWNCGQPATHTLTREGSNTLNACGNCTRIDRAEAEARGWSITPLNDTPPAPAETIEIGSRVAGHIAGQQFTGTVSQLGRKEGHHAIATDGTFTTIDPGELTSVTVRTDRELTTPAGRKVRSALLRGADEISTLRLL